MRHYAGLDVSVQETSICIINETGRVEFERKVTTHPEDILKGPHKSLLSLRAYWA